MPPTIADPSYPGLEVKDGGVAQDTFLEASSHHTHERRWAREEALKAYARHLMVVLVARTLAGA